MTAPATPARQPIGYVRAAGEFHSAECATCAWKIRKRARADAVSLLRSHFRITHNATPVYLED